MFNNLVYWSDLGVLYKIKNSKAQLIHQHADMVRYRFTTDTVMVCVLL